ncbi:hypothetical protein GOBAR_AA39826 [Gossypium barbadense]|uniref:Uncharacterized protein n=1 Tax=Gossypium barbadense TaxID=3634 RepID=A0A2P5VPZ7_GOSBA|nr:hypothetical protein GOBAR_AA39826 [Gossypium barbadense]
MDLVIIPNDVSTPGASSNTNQDLNELPKGPITQAHAKHFLEAILASNAKPWLAECGRYIHEEMHERESSMNGKIHARPGSMLGGN